MMDDGELLPLIAGVVGSLFVIGLSSLVALIAEEEETNAQAMALINTASRQWARAVISLHHGSPELLDEPPPKGRCIMADYLGESPKFALDDFKQIFRVSRSNYDKIDNYLGGINAFFRDGYDTVRREKISANSKILMA
jgi:hypothetical protein